MGNEDNSDNGSESWKSNKSSVATCEGSNKIYTNSIFETFPTNIAHSVNNSNCASSNEIASNVKFCKNIIEDINQSQVNNRKSQEVERELHLEKAYEIPSDISNSSRKSVITRADFLNSPEKDAGSVRHIKQLASFRESLHVDDDSCIVSRDELESLPEEEFVIVVNSEDSGEKPPSEFEEIAKIVEPLSSEDLDVVKNISITPIVKIVKGHISSPQGDAVEDLEQKSIFANEKIRPSVEEQNRVDKNQGNKDGKSTTFENQAHASDTIVCKIDEKSTAEENTITAVDEILEMFSRLPSSQKTGKVKRLKGVKKLANRTQNLKKKLLIRKGGKNCFFPLKKIKERDKVSHIKENHISECQLKASKNLLSSLEYENTANMCKVAINKNSDEADLSKVVFKNNKSSMCRPMEMNEIYSQGMKNIHEDVKAIKDSVNENKDCESSNNIVTHVGNSKILPNVNGKINKDKKEANGFSNSNVIDVKSVVNHTKITINERNEEEIKDTASAKRMKMEIDSQVSSNYKNPKENCEGQATSENINQPSSPESSNLKNIFKECITDITPISRLSESNNIMTSKFQHNPEESTCKNYKLLEAHLDSDNISNDSNESDFFGFSDVDYVEDSPESPPPYELICSINEFAPRLIPLERAIEYDANYSPLSPNHETNFDNHPAPVIIPAIRKFKAKENTNLQTLSKLNSALGRIVRKFDSAKHTALTKDKYQIEAAAESKIIIKIRHVLEHYVLSNATTVDVDRCIWRIVKRTRCRMILCKSIIEIIEDTKDKICNDLTPPLPVMTETHRKIIVLVNKLVSYIKTLNNSLITAVEQRLFNLKAEKIPLETLINLTLFYIALIDLHDTEKNSARLFIYKCLYYFNKKAVPMIYYVLVSYPAVLPKKSDPYYDRSDAIISSIQCILNSLVYNIDKKDLKHREVFHILKLYYEYDRVKPSREEVIENLMAKIRAGKFQNVSYSFALVCKHYGIEWTEKEVIMKHLLPALTEYFNLILQNDTHDMTAAVLLESLSFVLKPFPLNYNIERYLQIFTNFLHATERKIVQEAAVSAVLRVQRFGCVDCFNIICNWNPSYKINSNLRLMLRSFIHRKPLNFWKKLENQI